MQKMTCLHYGMQARKCVLVSLAYVLLSAYALRVTPLLLGSMTARCNQTMKLISETGATVPLRAQNSQVGMTYS